MHTLKITVVVAAAFALNGIAANTWWVDDDKYGASGDGTSAEKAFGTIQEALDNPSFAAGDTVKVLPGVYDKGETFDGYHSNRVLVAQSCTIVSTHGAGVTHIVGKFSSANANGTGPDAVRCVHFKDSLMDCRLEGFTLRGGAAAGGTTEASANYSGGVLGTSNAHQTVVDCVISNCVAYKGAAVRNAASVRVLGADNVILKADGSAFNGGNLHFCVVKNNKGGYACSTCSAQNCDLLNNTSSIAGGGTYRNVLLVGNGGSVAEKAVLINCCQQADLLVAPALGDYRPIAGSALDGAGVVEGFPNIANMSSAERYFDFNGNPVPTSGACDIGAVQGAVATAGALQVGAGGLIVDGIPVPANSLIFAAAYPTQWVVRAVPVEGKWEYGFKRTNTETDRFHSDLNGDAFVMPPPTGVTTVTTVYAEQAFWVNPNDDAQGQPIGSDDNDGSEAAPFRTLQKAMDVTANAVEAVVFAAPGYYTEGGRCIAEVQHNGQFLTNRLCSTSNNNHTRIIGAGPGRSFIVGEPDPDTGGNGPKAVRPVGVFCNFMTIQGFTLTNGWSAAATASSDNDKYGAAFGRNLSPKGVCVHMLDCEIVDCHGDQGVAINMNFSRCTFHDNFSTIGRTLSSCNASACLLEGDAGAYSCRQTSFYHCTLFAANPELAFSSNYNTFVASILCGGVETRPNDAAYGSLVWNVGDLSRGLGGWTVERPYFVDPANGDWRVRACSQAAVCAAVQNDDYWKFATSDLAGQRLTVTAGSPVAGCRQALCRDSGVYVGADKGGVSADDGWHAFGAGDTLTVTPAAGTRPCIGYVFGGETNLFDTVPSRTITAAECAAGAALEAIYTTDWYVDATQANDDGLAYSPATAKKTFAGLFGTGHVLAGDTVHAAEGVYDSGVMHRTETDPDSGAPLYAVGARVIVPAYVTVVAEGSQTNTVIRGAASTSGHEYGLGSDAVRCATLYAHARLSGFTLEDGRTDCNTAVGSEAYKEFPDNTGALVQGATKNQADAKASVVEDCILRNGVANRGGAAYVHLVRCRIHDCRGLDTAGAVGCTLRCYHTGTLVYNSLSGYCVMYPFSFVCSTVIDKVNAERGFYHPASNKEVRNSIIASGSRTQSSAVFENTIFASLPLNATEEMLDAGSRVVGADNLQFDDAGRPVIGANAGVDAGSAAVYESVRDLLGETDLSGRPRVMNGRIDVGALEADWWPAYAGLIGLSSVPRVEVTAASLAVTNGVGGVCVPAGASIAFRPTRSGKAVFSVAAAGNGAVVVFEDGVEVLPGRDGRYPVFNGEGEHVVTVSCTGDEGAYAFVSGLCSGRGFSINVR